MYSCSNLGRPEIDPVAGWCSCRDDKWAVEMELTSGRRIAEGFRSNSGMTQVGSSRSRLRELITDRFFSPLFWMLLAFF